MCKKKLYITPRRQRLKWKILPRVINRFTLYTLVHAGRRKGVHKAQTTVLNMEELVSVGKSIDAINISACRASERMWEAMDGLLTKKEGCEK